MSLIIGIDPGSRLTGYGIIEQDGSKLRFVDAGTIRTETTEMPERLKRIFAGIDRIVKFHGPTQAAVEQVFMAQNPDSALKLGQARGAAIAALTNLDLQVAEYIAHISHDTVIGNNCVFGYGTKIAGDCVIGNGVIYSTSVVENAKTRVGDLAMIQAGTTFSKDIPPYIIAGGKPVMYAGPNSIIMEAASIDFPPGDAQRSRTSA